MLKQETLSDYIFDMLHQGLNRKLHSGGRDFLGKIIGFYLSMRVLRVRETRRKKLKLIYLNV